MNVRALRDALNDLIAGEPGIEDAEIGCGHLDITGHIETIETISTGRCCMSEADDGDGPKRQRVVVFELAETTLNIDEDLDLDDEDDEDAD